MWIGRILRQWLVVVELLVGGAFMAGDAAGWIEMRTGSRPPSEVVYIAVFVVFGITALVQLVRLEARVDHQAETRRAITALTPFVQSGNDLLGKYGRPWSPGQPPMLMLEQGLPDLNAWYARVDPVVVLYAPDFVATWNNDGPIYEGAEQKPVAIQHLEGRLMRLGKIVKELRARLYVP
jgi:hypothetical protein